MRGNDVYRNLSESVGDEVQKLAANVAASLEAWSSEFNLPFKVRYKQERYKQERRKDVQKGYIAGRAYVT